MMTTLQYGKHTQVSKNKILSSLWLSIVHIVAILMRKEYA